MSLSENPLLLQAQIMAKKLNTNQPMVISYLRFSSPEQMKGDSTRRQTALAERWCQDQGLSLTDRFSDKGISAFRGNNTTNGALVAFLELVKARSVPKGSILLVEELDRISRQSPEESVSLFLSIISAGVTVVTLKDGCVYRKGENEMGKLMQSVMRLCLAHEESSKKSFRLAEAWKNKRSKALERPLTSRIPAWLKISEGRIVVDESKAEIVQQMFQMATNGYGLTAITKEANRRWKGIGRKPHFSRSSVNKILHNPQVIGIFQPHRLIHDEKGKRREPVGGQLTGYYPAIVGENEFFAVQKLLKDRRRSGGPNEKFINLFQGLLFNKTDGSPMVILNKGSNRQYVSAAAAEGRKGAAPYLAFPTISLEVALIEMIAKFENLNLGDMNGERLERDLAAAEGKLGAVTRKIQQLQAALLGQEDVQAVIEVIVAQEGQKKMLEDRRNHLRAECAAAKQSSGQDALQQIRDLLLMNFFITNTNDERIRLRTLLRHAVKRIECGIIKDGHRRACGVDLTFADDRSTHFVVEINVRRWADIDVVDEFGKRWNFPMWEQAPPAITSGVIQQIKDRWARGEGGSAIAKELKVSVSTVYRHKPEDWSPKWAVSYTRLKEIRTKKGMSVR